MEELSHTSDIKILDSITDISFGEYVEVVLGNLSIIDVNKNASEEDLQVARKVLMCEFAESSGNYDFASASSVSSKQAKNNIRIAQLEIAKCLIENGYDERTFNVLKEMRLIPQNTKFTEDYSNTDALIAKMNGELTSLHIKQSTLSVNDDKEKENREVTKKDFIRLLASVSTFVKFGVGLETNCAIVAEYVNRMQQYNMSMESRKLKK